MAERYAKENGMWIPMDEIIDLGEYKYNTYRVSL